jgi:hypothetical protein
VKIRGTAHHIGEKYLQLARDAQSSGDPVMAESYLQHAEHYFRLIAAAQQQQNLGYQRQPGEADVEELEDEDEFGGVPDRFASPMERFAAPAQNFGGQAQNGQQPYPDRPFYNNNNNERNERQGYDRPERGPRPERSQERSFQDKPYQDRPYHERNGRDSEGRGHEGRGPRGGRGQRDYRNEGQPRLDRNEPRAEARAPVEEVEAQGLPAFITGPVRIQPDLADSGVEALTPEIAEQPEATGEPNGFHLRPRRRRRTKAEMAMEQGSRSEAASAKDPVGD